MESSERPCAARRSTGEWLFQLTTITLARLLELRAQLQLDEQLGRQLLESYVSYDRR